VASGERCGVVMHAKGVVEGIDAVKYQFAFMLMCSKQGT
jgi:hypothetical protein